VVRLEVRARVWTGGAFRDRGCCDRRSLCDGDAILGAFLAIDSRLLEGGQWVCGAFVPVTFF
jgi:hypothetical protein